MLRLLTKLKSHFFKEKSSFHRLPFQRDESDMGFSYAILDFSIFFLLSNIQRKQLIRNPAISESPYLQIF